MSDKRKDGGPAFPQLSVSAPPEQQGMSLRDWFAGQALAGLLANEGLNYSAEFLADYSYGVANEMLHRRRK